MEHDTLASVLVLPDISAFWPGLATPQWTVDGISAVQRWFGNGDQFVYVGSPDFTINELTDDSAGFNHAWTHWTHQQSKHGRMPHVMITQNGLVSTAVHAFGPQFVESDRQITLFIADKSDFEACSRNRMRVSLAWRNLLDGHFDVDRWDSSSMLMGNLHRTVAAPKFLQITVLDEIQGRLVPTVVTIPTAA